MIIMCMILGGSAALRWSGLLIPDLWLLGWDLIVKFSEFRTISQWRAGSSTLLFPMKMIFWWGFVNPICTQELVNEAHGWPLAQVRVAAPQAEDEHCLHIGHLKVAVQARVGDLIDPQVDCSKLAMLRVRLPHIVVQEPLGAAMTLPELPIIIWSIKSRGRLSDQLCKVELAKTKSSPSSKQHPRICRIYSNRAANLKFQVDKTR